MEGAIYQIVRDIWTAVLGLDIRWGTRKVPETGTWTTTVRLSGAWNGAVVLQCSQPLARRVASKMFSVKPEVVSDDQVRDALGELTNMAAGNIKALLPDPVRLSMPTAGPGAAPQPGRLAAKTNLECDGEPLAVELMEAEEGPKVDEPRKH